MTPWLGAIGLGTLTGVFLWLVTRTVAATVRRVATRATAKPPTHPAVITSRHGGLDYTARRWNCGRVRIWDGDGNVTWREDCGCPDPWDEALERLVREDRP